MERFFISRPIFAMALSAAIVIVGLISVERLPIEQYPDITPPVVEVSASYAGADAESVDNAVATPLAQAVMGVEKMLYMKSTSAGDGSMTLQVTFEVGSDPDMDAIFTQNNVSTALAQLPAAVTQQGVTTLKTSTGFLMVYALHSDGRYDGEFLSNYAYINLQNELLKIDGVGKVSVMGAGEYAMRVWLRPDVLKYYNLDVGQIADAIATQAGVYPSGQLGAEPAPEGTVYTYTVTLPRRISTAGEFEQIVLRMTPQGEIIRLGDVAEIELGSRSYGSESLYGDDPTALVVVYQQPGSNAMEVGANVKAALDRLGSRFPDGMELTKIVDATESIEAGVKDIFVTLIIALVLVIAIIYLFIQDWRATLIPLIAIPVSLIGSFALFPLLGFTINIISLLGMVLAIGLVVDDAIVVVEAAQVAIAAGRPPREAAAEAMRGVAGPIVATTVVLLAVFIPVSFMGGISGRLFQQFSITIAVSVVISSINALTLSPALCGLLLRPHREVERGFFGSFNRWFDRMVERYMGFAPRMMRHVACTALFVAVSGAAIFVVGHLLPSGFLPEEDQGYVMVMVETPEATSLQLTLEALREVNKTVAARKDVEASSLVAGFDMMSGTASTSCGVIFARLVDYGKRKLSASEIAAQLTGELYAAVPQATSYAFIPPSIPGLGVTSGVTFEVQDVEGRGTEYLAAAAERLIDTLRKSPLIAAATTQFRGDVPQRHLRIDREHALSEGVDLKRLYTQLATLMGGSYTGNFTRFGRLYQTWLQAAPEYRRDRNALDSYYIESSSGESIPLATFVEVVDTVGVSFVSQFNLYRSIEVMATPADKASSADVMEEITRLAAATLPDGIATAWSGTSYQQEATSRNNAAVYLVALVFVFLALAALYESWTLPIAILLSVPTAVLGAVVFIAVAHLADPLYVNDIYMQISIVMLIGLAAKNAILVVEYADRLFHEERLPLLDAAIEAARLRLRPIIMTAFSFILGVVPLVFASGVYATARNVMGVALVGGMVVATLSGIFLYPALYYAVGRVFGFEKDMDTQQTKP